MDKKVAIVTGSARGIGYAIAQRLGHAGAHVVMIDAMEDTLRSSAHALEQAGITCTPVVLDLSSPEQVAKLPLRIESLFGQVAVLVNNAALSLKKNGRRIPVSEIDLADWERVVQINFTAPFQLSQMVLDPMRRRGWGRIVNISSKAGRTPSGVPGVDYVATKTGLIGLSRAIAKEVAGQGITVNSVAPGRIRTPMGENIDDETRARILAGIPVNRMGEPDEIAALVQFLVSNEAGFITGAVMDINGGALMI